MAKSHRQRLWTRSKMSSRDGCLVRLGASLPLRSAAGRVVAFLCAAVVLVLFSTENLTAAEPSLTLAQDSEPRVTILVAKDAGPPVRHAADELAAYLSRVTGGRFKIRATRPAKTPVIAVGPKAARMVQPDFSVEGLTTEGIVLRTVNGSLILAGGNRRGTLYAIYSFLEDFVGCHWWAPDAETVPSRPTLNIPQIDVRYVPQFEYRDISYHDASDPDFSVRNKLNGHHHRLFHDDGYHNVVPDFKRGGRRWNWLRSDKWGTHAAYLLLPPEVYFKDHPEWYAEVRDDQPHGVGYIGYPNAAGTGRRPLSVEECNKQRRPLCLSNPELRAEAVRNVRWAMSWGVAASLWDLSQIDGMNACRCQQCMDIVNEEGAYSGLRLRFANSIAKEFLRTSGSHFTTLAYHYTRKPPKHAKPGENVIVLLVTAYDELPSGKNTEISYAVPLNHERNRSFARDLTGWVNTGGRIYIYDYAANFSHPIMPFPNVRVLGPNLRFFRDQGIRGYASEAHSRTPGTELAELRTWLAARLAWNPDLDAQQLIRTFCSGYYGAAAGPHIVAYIDALHDAVAETDEWLHVGWGYDAKYLNWPYVKTAWQHLNRAAEAADSDQLKFRVQVARLPLQYISLMRWNEHRTAAQQAGDAWPLPDNSRQVLDQFIEIAERRKISTLKTILNQPQIRSILEAQ